MDFTVNKSVTSAMLTTSSLKYTHVSVICCDTTKNYEDTECEQCATSILQVNNKLTYNTLAKG